MNKIVLVILTLAVLMPQIGAAADSPTIPVGTVIDHSNWQQYRDFMTYTLAGEFTSKSPITDVPAAAKIVIGPTKHYPVGHWYWDATEKYSRQVRLVKAPSGGYTLTGYVAGQPFPFYSLDLAHDPLVGYKLLYDMYFQYLPAIALYNRARNINTDRYGNTSVSMALLIDRILMHNTDPGFPMTIAGGPGQGDVYFTSYSELLTPIQRLYTTSLERDFDNPEIFPETYLFLPSLRRVLRLSTSSRCAPYATADFNYDDHARAPQPPTWFKAQFLGLKNMLAFVIPPDKLHAAADRANYYSSRAPLFPKPEALGPWQMRPWYVLSFSRLAQYSRGYCEAQNIRYLDQEAVVTVAWDDFDQNDKFWRGFYGFMPALPHPADPEHAFAFIGGDYVHNNVDFQADHSHSGLPPVNGPDGVLIDSQVPAKYRSYARYSTPAGLEQILQ